MNELYVSDYIKSVTIEYTDNYVRVIEDQYMINQLDCLLAVVSQEDELEINKLLKQEGKTVNSVVNNDEVDFLFCHNRYENDDISFDNRASGDSIIINN